MLSTKHQLVAPAQSHASSAGVMMISVCALNCVGQSNVVVMPYWVSHLISTGTVTASTAAYLTGVELACSALANLVALRYLFVLSLRLQLLIGIGALVAGNLVCLNMTVPALYLGRAAVGIGSGVVVALAQAVAAHVPSPGRVYALMYAALLIFSLTAFNLTPIAMKYAGAGGGFSFFAVIYLVSMILIPLFRGRLSDNRSLRVEHRGLRYSWAIWLAIAGASFNVQGLWSYAFAGAERLGLAEAHVSNAMSLSLACGFLAGILAALIAGKRQRLIIVGIGLGVLGIATFSFGYVQSSALYLATLSLLPVGSAFLLPALSDVLVDIDPSGRDVAASQIAISIGSALGTPAVGLAIQSARYGLFTVASVLALAMALVLTAITIRRVPAL